MIPHNIIHMYFSFISVYYIYRYSNHLPFFSLQKRSPKVVRIIFVVTTFFLGVENMKYPDSTVLAYYVKNYLPTGEMLTCHDAKYEYQKTIHQIWMIFMILQDM